MTLPKTDSHCSLAACISAFVPQHMGIIFWEYFINLKDTCVSVWWWRQVACVLLELSSTGVKCSPVTSFSLICFSWDLEKLSSDSGRSSLILLLWSCQNSKSTLILSLEVEEMYPVLLRLQSKSCEQRGCSWTALLSLFLWEKRCVCLKMIHTGLFTGKNTISIN